MVGGVARRMQVARIRDLSHTLHVPVAQSPLRASVKIAFLVACISVPKDPCAHPFQKGPLCASILRWGWVFLERMQIRSGIQFPTHFIEIFVVETKRFVGSFVNVILTRQTCGQRC